MQKIKLAFWVICFFLVTACAGSIPVEDGENLATFDAANCPDSVMIHGNTTASPHETIMLAAVPTSLEWQFSWSAAAGALSASQASVTNFTAPATPGLVNVFVTVSGGQGCNPVSQSVEIVVENSIPPTFTATATPAPTNTAVVVSSPTASPTQTFTPPATNTAVITPTTTNTLPPPPTHTPTVLAFQILLQEPKNETCVGADNAVFEWLASRPLNTIEGPNGEYFALNIWAEGSQVYSVSWIKEPKYEIENISDPIAAYTQQINCNGENGCYWNVDLLIAHVNRGSGWLPESFTKIASSPVRNFCTELAPPPIPPTSTPEPTADTPIFVPCPPEC